MFRNIFANIPNVTKNLLLINVLLFVVSIFFAQNETGFDTLLSGHYLNSPLFKPFQIISHMFMHSLTDPFHIIFNMFLLVSFGSHLERIWGAKRYFIFYISCGLGAFLLYNAIGVWQIMELKTILENAGNDMDIIDDIIRGGDVIVQSYDGSFFNKEYLETLMKNGELVLTTNDQFEAFRDYYLMSNSTIVGASGAIFGLLAGFAMLFPNTELMLMFIPVPIKAKYLIGAYLLFEVYNSINQTAGDNIAHLAHVGGAVVGIIFILIWRKDKQNFY